MQRKLEAKPTVDPADVESETLTYLSKRAILPSELVSGKWLFKAATENAQTCRRLSKARPLGPECQLSWGSCCSGSEGVRFVADALNHIFSQEGSACQLKHAFSCELHPEKKKWISFVNSCGKVVVDRVLTGAVASDTAENVVEQAGLPCIFNNILDLGGPSGTAECWQHAGLCRAPSVDVLVLGTSCKDMSRANPSSAVRRETVLQQQTSKGGSAQTFRGFLLYLDARRPPIVLFENVDSMEDSKPGGQSNADIFHAEVSSRGYACLREGGVYTCSLFVWQETLCCHSKEGR